MAATTYQFTNRVADDPNVTIDDLALFLKHCVQWNLRPTASPFSLNAGYLRFTVNNPIPADQEAHLNVTKL